MPINLRDYSRTAAQRGWGAGWPSCSGAKAAGTAVVTADRSGTRFSVHKRIARLVDLISDECERRDYLIKSGQTGGYNCRAIGGTSSPSNHSWGLAIDINWLSNPMRNPLTTDIPGWMVAIFNRYGFAWGGHYSGTKDAMHFEFMGTPAQADEMTALALRELTAAPKQEDPLMALSDAEQRELLDGLRDVRRWLGPVDFVPPGGDPTKPWSVTANQAVANTYVGMFYGGRSTGDRSLFQAITDAAGQSPLSDADVQRIARAVIAGLGGSVPGQPLAQVYEFTGTATPRDPA